MIGTKINNCIIIILSKSLRVNSIRNDVVEAVKGCKCEDIGINAQSLSYSFLNKLTTDSSSHSLSNKETFFLRTG